MLQEQWDYLKTTQAFRSHPALVLWRLAVWRLICSLKLSTRVEMRRWHYSLRVPPEWRGISKLLFAFREAYEPELAVMEKILRPGDIMVDAGANYGVYSLTASRLVGLHGRVIAFEPAARTFSELQKNINENHADNVIALQMALSGKAGSARLYHREDAGRNTLAGEESEADFEVVQVGTIDEVLEQMGIKKVHLFKIDTEGADELVCRGAKNMLVQSHPVVFFEVNEAPAKKLGLDGTGVHKLLAGLGYDFYRISNLGEMERLADHPSDGNVMAIFNARPSTT